MGCSSRAAAGAASHGLCAVLQGRQLRCVRLYFVLLQQSAKGFALI